MSRCVVSGMDAKRSDIMEEDNVKRGRVVIVT